VELLLDSQTYITEAKNEVDSLPADEQVQIENQLDQTQADQQQAETQLNQEGVQGG
jgi:hypothetical protein